MDKPPSLLGLDRTTKPLIRLSLLLLWQWVYICGKAKSKSMSDSTGSLSRLNPSSQRTGWLKTGGAEYGARTSSAKPTNGINQSFVRKRRIKPRSSQAPSGRAGEKNGLLLNSWASEKPRSKERSCWLTLEGLKTKTYALCWKVNVYYILRYLTYWNNT